jgi:hypothetical protein
MVIRVICDSNIHDAIAADAKLKQLVDQCQATGRITFKITHVQLGELAEIPSDRDIGQANAINAERIGPSIFVLGHSRLDEDRLGTAETNSAFAAIQKGSPRHTEDAMIGATALTDADILVTNDGNFSKKFEALGTNVKVMSSVEFAIYLAGLSTGSISG